MFVTRERCGPTPPPRRTAPPHAPPAPPRWEGAPTNLPRHPLVLDDERIVPVGIAFDDEGTGPLAGVHLTLDSLDGDTAAPRDVRGPPPRRAPDVLGANFSSSWAPSRPRHPAG